MSDIPLIPRPFKRLSREERQAFAISKKDQEERALAHDHTQVKQLSSAYERKIAEERRRLGL